jgi:hypothetical protein
MPARVMSAPPLKVKAAIYTDGEGGREMNRGK